MGFFDGVKDFFKNPLNILFPTFGLANKQQIDTYKLLRQKKPGRDPINDPGLQDKSFSPADYGVPLTVGYGKFKTNGKVIWSFDTFEEYTATSDGGGFVVSERLYHIDIAWKLCKGPVVGVSRIWLDDTLVLDVRSGTTGAIGDGVTSYVQNSDGTITFNRTGKNGPEIWRIYHGTDTQSADPTMEATLGVGNVPAHRGWCYISVDHLHLNPFGRRVPNMSAEVVQSGAVQSSNSLHTLNRQADSPGSALGATAPGLEYDSLNNAIISVLSITSGTMRWQTESVTPTNNSRLWTTSNTNYSGHAGLVGHVVDISAGVVWFRDGQRVVARLLTTGNTAVESIEASSTTETYKGIGIHQARGEIWVTSGTTTFIRLSRSALLSGSTFAAATIGTVSNPFGTSGASFSYHARTSKLIAKGANTSRDFVLYDSAGTVSGTYSLGETGETCEYIFPDPDKDYLWAITNNTASALGRCLRRITLSTMTDTVAISGLGAEFLCITKDAGRNAIVTYRSSDKSLIWVDVDSFALVKTYSITADATASGAPKQLCFVPLFGDIYATFSETILMQYKLDYIVDDATALSTVVTGLADSVGIVSGDLNVSAITSSTIKGFAIEDRAQAKFALDVLQRSSFFDLVQENGKVTAKKRGGASVMTIDYSELALDDGDEQRRPYDFIRLDEIDNAARLEVLYSDVDLEYEDGVQASTRHVVRSREVERQTIPVLMTASQAKQVAEVELYSRWSQRVGIRLNGTRKHWKLRAGDVFTFTDELGVSRTLLCTKIEFTSMTSCVIEARMEDASVYTSTVTGAGVNWTPPVISASTGKRFELLDIPLVKDADDYQGFYVVALTGAPTAYLHESTDGGVTYTNKGAIAESVIGYASTALANFTGGNVWDTVSTVTVVVYDGSLTSATDAQLLAGVNMFLCGNEIIQAGTVTPSGTNTYILSRLLRGRRGTEWAISLHSAGERFVALSTLTRIASTVRGSLAYYKAVPATVDEASVAATAFTNTQAGMKPYSPVYISGSRDGGLNLTITWTRRSRIGSAWGTVIDMPLGETTEQYQIDIMQGSTVKRTITVNAATSATYTAAEQTTDFGATQSSVVVNIYQMSTVVGRGTVGVATI